MMDQSGDQCDSGVTESMNNLHLIDKMGPICDNSLIESKVLIEIMDEMKDKCEAFAANEDNRSLDTLSVKDDKSEQHLRRVDSEADIDVSEDQIDSIDDKPRDEEVIRVHVVSTEPIEPQNERQTKPLLATNEVPVRAISFGHQFRYNPVSKDGKPKTEKWGESVGITDENGFVKRVVNLNELHNYLILKSSSQKIDSNIYCSLINERFPRFFDSTIDYLQRWRMRYNIFADKVLIDRSEPSLVHIGELHLYFDLVPKHTNPYYVNNSFYVNSMPSEKPLDEECVRKVKSVLESIRRTREIFQLKFPLNSSYFQNTNHIFDKFMERQQDLCEEAQTVHRKNELKRRFNYGPRRGHPKQSTVPRGSMTHFETQFSQSSRDFHQTGREFARSDRNMRGIGRPFAPNERNEEFNESRGYGRNDRRFGRMSGRGFVDSKRGMDRKQRSFNGNNRRNPSVGNTNDSDVTFEDTRERHEKNENKCLFNKTNKGFNHFDHYNNRPNEQRLDGFRLKTETNFGSNERNYRNNGRQMDSENRRRPSEPFKGPKDKHYFSSGFNVCPQTGPQMDVEQNRRPSYGHNYTLGHSHPLI